MARRFLFLSGGEPIASTALPTYAARSGFAFDDASLAWTVTSVAASEGDASDPTDVLNLYVDDHDGTPVR